MYQQIYHIFIKEIKIEVKIRYCYKQYGKDKRKCRVCKRCESSITDEAIAVEAFGEDRWICITNFARLNDRFV